MLKNKDNSVQEKGYTKLILKYLGFLKDNYGFNFKFQTFSEYMNFSGPIYTYSFYNDYGCFTLHNVAQKNEWGWFVSRKFSLDQYELLSKEIIQTDFLQKNYWFLSSILKDLALTIKSQIKKNSNFFGIRVN